MISKQQNFEIVKNECIYVLEGLRVYVVLRFGQEAMGLAGWSERSEVEGVLKRDAGAGVSMIYTAVAYLAYDIWVGCFAYHYQEPC